MIVKVQISPFSPSGQTMILISDKNLDTIKKIPANEKILKLLNGRPTSFIYAEMDRGNLTLNLKEAPWQEW